MTLANVSIVDKKKRNSCIYNYIHVGLPRWDGFFLLSVRVIVLLIVIYMKDISYINAKQRIQQINQNLT